MIFCCGNPDRGDDAAGPLVGRRLQTLGIEARECSDALVLLEELRRAGNAIVVDAVETGALPGTVSMWDGAEPLPAYIRFGCSTHSFGVAEAVELARSLGVLPKRLTLYGIEAEPFAFVPGGSPSPAVLAAVEEVAQRIRATRRAMPGACYPQE
jgi:hydrogenase maturation protease